MKTVAERMRKYRAKKALSIAVGRAVRCGMTWQEVLATVTQIGVTKRSGGVS